MLRRGSFLLVSACAVFLASGTDSARSRAAASFSVSVLGKQLTVVTRTRTTTDDVGCSVTRREVDRQTMTFSTSRPGRVLVGAGGRAGPTHVAVTVAASGSKTRATSVAGPEPDCAVAPQTSETDCGPVRVLGDTVVRLPAPGTLSVGGSLTHRRDRSRCAPQTARAYPFLLRSQGRFKAGHLTDPTIEQVRLRGRTVVTDRLVSRSRRVTTVTWTVVFRRLG